MNVHVYTMTAYTHIKSVIGIPYSRIFSRGPIFKVFTDDRLTAKIKHAK